jgi:hypothetical protein
VPGPGRDGSDPGPHGKRVAGTEPFDTSGFADQFGGTQRTASGELQQRWCYLFDESSDLSFEAVGFFGDRPDASHFATCQVSDQSGVALQHGHRPVQASVAAEGPRWGIELGFQLVEPPQPILRSGAFPYQGFSIVDQQFHVAGRAIEVRPGQLGLPQRSPSDRSSVDRIRLARLSGALAGTRHHLGRYPDHRLTRSEQLGFETARHVAAILDRPHPVLIELATHFTASR